MYIYLQKSGEIYEIPICLELGSLKNKTEILANRGRLMGTGYSGHGDGMNNPDAEKKPLVGPIPKGWYRIGEPECVPPEPAGSHGPYIIPLQPDGHYAFGRSGFLIHGDNATHAASCGCIVLNRPLREEIGSGVSRYLLVMNLA